MNSTTGNKSPESAQWHIGSVLADSAKVAGIIVLRILLLGFAGLVIGVAPVFLFRPWLSRVAPGLNPLIYFGAAVVYFCGIGAVLWGFLGFFNGLAKALHFVLFEKKGLAFLTSRLSGQVMIFIQKKYPDRFGLEAGATDFEKTAITFEMFKNALEHFKGRDSAAETIQAGAPAGKKPGIAVRILLWFLRSKLIGRLGEIAYRRFKEKGGTLTFAETRQLIVDLGNEAGEEILSDFASAKTLMFSLFILLHLGLPFSVVYIIIRTR